MKAWIKGGIWGLIIPVIAAGIAGLFQILNIQGSIIDFIYLIILLPIGVAFYTGGKYIILNVVLALVLTIAFYFGVGALIGWIISLFVNNDGEEQQIT